MMAQRGGPAFSRSRRAGPTPFRFIGRGKELAVLTEAITTTRTAPSPVLVEGPAGIGVTTLLHAAADLARREGRTVLPVHGVAAEAELEFAALERLLRPALPGLPGLPAAQQQALGRAVGLRSGSRSDPGPVATAAASLLAAFGFRRPVVLVVDDLQWLDAGTAAVLDQLARTGGGLPILLIAGAHAGELEATGGRRGVGSDSWTALARRVTLGPLDPVAAADLVRDIDPQLGDDARAWVLEQAAGHPLALVELTAVAPRRDDLRWLAPLPPPLPPRLSGAFTGLFTALPPDTRAALLAAAVGISGDLTDVLAAASVLHAGPVGPAALASASRWPLVTVEQEVVAFSYPFVAAAIRHQEPLARQQAAHAAWAAILPAGHPLRSWHLAGATSVPAEHVARELEEAAGRQLQAGRIPQAIVAWEQSAECSPRSTERARRLLMAAELATATGRQRLAGRLVDRAEEAGIVGVERLRWEVLRDSPLSAVSDDRTRITELCLVADQAAAAGDRNLSRKALFAAAQRCWWAAPAADDRSRVALAALRAFDEDGDARCVAAVALAEPIRCARLVLSMLDGFGSAGATDPLSLRMLGLAAHAVGDEVRAAELSRRAEEPLRAIGMVGALGHALGVSSTAMLDLGEWSGAAEASAEGSALAKDAGQLIGSAGARITRARLLALRGDTGAALDLVTDVEHDRLLRSLANFRCRAQIVRGIALISDGRNEDACTALEKIFDDRQACYHEREQVGGLMYLAEAAAASGRRSRAVGILADMEDLAVTTGSPLLTTHLLYARPLLADDEEATEILFLAAMGVDLSAWPWTRARILLAYGGWLRRRRRAAASRAPLREALAVLDGLGAGGWAEQARRELQATGERRETPADDALSSLSAQELQIAHLVARGLSNAEIGEQLHLSRRTVGSHLYRIFPKLDITSRGQIARLVSDRAPGEGPGHVHR